MLFNVIVKNKEKMVREEDMPIDIYYNKLLGIINYILFK